MRDRELWSFLLTFFLLFFPDSFVFIFFSKGWKLFDVVLIFGHFLIFIDFLDFSSSFSSFSVISCCFLQPYVLLSPLYSFYFILLISYFHSSLLISHLSILLSSILNEISKTFHRNPIKRSST